MSRPPTSTRPSLGGMKPVMTRIVVVFPAPFGPRKPRTSPFATPKLRSATAGVLPYRLDTRSTRTRGSTGC